MADLAEGLLEQGAQPTVLTACWDREWPRRMDWNGIPVYRLPLARGRLWGNLRYLQVLAKWLRQHAAEFDVALTARLRCDAYATCRALRRTRIPVVLRAEPDDLAWQESSLLGARCRARCRQAAAIVTPDAELLPALARAGYDAQRLWQIPDGLRPGPLHTGGRRFDARQALASANADLTAAIDALIVVCFSPLEQHRNLAGLIRAFRPVVLRWPTARLWLIGDGPFRDFLYQLISDLDLRHAVRMPGTFDDVEEILLAANLVVQPEISPGVDRCLLEAVAAGLPVLAADSAGPASASGSGRGGSMRAGGSAGGLERSPRPDAGISARRDDSGSPPALVLQQHSPQQMTRRYLDLFEGLLARPPKAG